MIGSDGKVVTIAGETLDKLTVAAGTEGAYQLSVTGEHHNLAAGQYKLQFVREVDVARAQAKNASPEPLFEVEISHGVRHWFFIY